MPHLETASLGVWVGAGSRDEQPDEHGISHLLEHMAFKGTRARTARQIAEEIEAVGGDLNAATSVETTAYYARVLKDDVPLALDILADILPDPAFDPDELEREQNVILQEIGAVEDTPDDLVFEYLQAIAFPDQPIGRSILGTPETVRSFDGGKLRAYLARNYRAPDMVVAAAGAVDHAAVVAEVEQRFASFNGPAAPTPRAGALRRRQRMRDARARAGAYRARASGRAADAIRRFTACRCSPTCSAAACRRGCSRRCARSAACATRSMPSMCPIPTPACSASMPAPTPPTRRTDAAWWSTRSRDAAETITEAEVARAKAQMKAGLLMALESSGARTEQLARQMIASAGRFRSTSSSRRSRR